MQPLDFAAAFANSLGSMPGLLLAALVSMGVVIWICWREVPGRRAYDFLRDEGGAGYTLSFVFTMPIFILIVGIVLECAFILTTKLGTVYAAFATARSAIVWEGTVPEDRALVEQRVRWAAIHAMVPFASGYGPGAASGAPDGIQAFVAMTQKYPRTTGFNDGFVERKYRHAAFATTVDWQPRGLTLPDTDIEARIVHDYPFILPGVGRIFGQQRGAGFVYPVEARVKLQSESPEGGKIGIEYAPN